MRTANNNEINQILEDAFGKGTIEKPYSILFVSHLDDDVKAIIESWCNKHNTFLGAPGYYYKTDSSGTLYQTNSFGFDCSISGHDVVFQRDECGTNNDIEWKNNVHKAFKDLKYKNGIVVDKELKLIIYSILYPLWSGNAPLFDENDYSMFDEVIHLTMDEAVFKESFIKKYDQLIDANQNTKYCAKLCFQKKVGLYVLEHPKFHFFPITDTGEKDTIWGGNILERFCPVDFYHWITLVDSKDQLFPDEYLNIPKSGKKMIIEILKDLKID